MTICTAAETVMTIKLVMSNCEEGFTGKKEQREIIKYSPSMCAKVLVEKKCKR